MKRKNILLILLALAFVMRIIPAILIKGIGDIYNFHYTAYLISNGAFNIYNTDAAYNYPPLFGYLIAGALQLANHDVKIFFIYFKLISIMADLAIVYILYNSTKNNTDSLYYGLIYAINPISIWITSFHGQFDSLPILFSLMAWMYFKNNKLTFAGISLSIGIMLKIFPILLLPLFIQKIKNNSSKYKFMIISLFPILTIMLPFFILSPQEVFTKVLNYSPLVGFFGYTFIMKYVFGLNVDILQHYGKILLISAYFLFILTLSKYDILESGITNIFLIFYIYSAAVACQYLMWILPFLILTTKKSLSIFYSIAGALYIIAEQMGFRNQYPELDFLRTIYNFNVVLTPLSVLIYLFCIYLLYKKMIEKNLKGIYTTDGSARKTNEE